MHFDSELLTLKNYSIMNLWLNIIFVKLKMVGIGKILASGISAIHLLNWFYSFSLDRLSLICFCNWKKKKKKKLVWKIRVNPTRHDPQLDWPVTRLIRKPDPTRPFFHVYLIQLIHMPYKGLQTLYMNSKN